MSVFGKIMDKIFHRGGKPQSKAAPTPPPNTAVASAGRPSSPAPTTTAPQAALTAQVDVGAVLTSMADLKGGGGNYQSSIVDLLKLLDLDPSLAARKELTEELGVRAGADGSAEQNIALHKAVMAKLAENGGIVPDSLRN
jgi:hypothetical protein